MGKYENKDLCASCGGKCCKRMGCEVFPEDVKEWYGSITEETIKKMIESGDFSIDWYEGYSMEYRYGYYIRARNINAPIVDPSWGGQCSCLTSYGCKFDFSHRPSGGRYLIPKMNENCASKYDKRKVAEMWEPYFHILEKIKVEYEVNYSDFGSNLLLTLLDLFNEPF